MRSRISLAVLAVILLGAGLAFHALEFFTSGRINEPKFHGDPMYQLAALLVGCIGILMVAKGIGWFRKLVV